MQIGLCGPAYRPRALSADAESCINFYPERIERDGKSSIALYATPGRKVFQTLGEIPVRGEVATRSGPARAFFVGGSKLYEVDNTGTIVRTVSGLTNDSQRVSMAAGGTQILIASAGVPFVYDLNANTLSAVPQLTALLPTVVQVGYSDGFFIAFNANKIAASSPLDATTWPGLQIATVSIFPDNIQSMIVDHRELFLWGTTKSIVYYDSGNLFPFDPNPSGIIEYGINAPLSAVRADNSVFWLHGSERGNNIVYRTRGYVPDRVSDHGVEFALNSYSTTADAVGFAVELMGHTFVVWYFPTANATWVYDTVTGWWHQWGFWNAQKAAFDAHNTWGHVFVFGKHLLSDSKSGNIYDWSINYLDDFGNPLVRERTAPHLHVEREWVTYPKIEIDLETGQGPEPPLLLNGAYDSTRVQLTRGGNTTGLGFDAGVSVNGRTYNISVLVQNNDSVNSIQLTSVVNPITVGPGATVLAQGTTVGDGVSHVQLQIISLGNHAMDFTAHNPVIFDTVTQVNLIPGSGATFVTGWAAIGSGPVPTVTRQQNQPTPGSIVRGPQIMLSWSDDGGRTYSNVYVLDCGQAGQYRARAIKRKLGKARTRTFRIRVSDAVPWLIVSAYVPPPIERQAQQLRKVR